MRVKKKEDDEEFENGRKGGKTLEEKELDEDLLPEQGLYTIEGHLFYHTTPVQLTKAMYKRAEEHDINLRSSSKFTIEETVQIFLNWHEFAEKTNIQTDNVLGYIQAKKKQHPHILKHQEEHQFWPKFCHGLPHRSCQSIKKRAIQMMTDDFFKTLDEDWSAENLVEKIREKFFKQEVYDDVTMEKMMKLLDKGYSAAYAGEILDLPVAKAANMSAKLRSEERREDTEMLRQFYEASIFYGLNTTKLRDHVIDDNELNLDRLRKDVNIEKLSVRMHLRPARCNELLKTVLQMILKKFRSAKEEEFTDEQAWRDAIGEFSPKLPLREEQTGKALEIFCHSVTKEDTLLTLKRDEQLEKRLKLEGITNFQCDTSEFQYLHGRIYTWMFPMEREVYRNLRCGFRSQVKLHCVLWAYKRMEVWEKLVVEGEKTRYQTVLECELANPLASKMTLKFLKNEKVCEWIMEPRPRKHPKNAATLRLEACVEAFILYTFQKFGGNFKFPEKLSPLVARTSSATIRDLLPQVLDPENSEYLTMKEAKKIVAKGSGKKILVTVRSKAIAMKKDVYSGEDSDDVEDPHDVESLVKHSRQVEDQRSEELTQEIASTLEKADPSKIRKKFRKREEEAEEIWLNDNLHKEKVAMRNLAKKSKQEEVIVYPSKEFLSTSDDDSSGDDEREVKWAESEEVEVPDVDSDFGSERSEKFRKKKDKKSKKREHRESEVSEAGFVKSSDGTSELTPEDATASESQEPDFKAPEGVMDSEYESESKEKKKDKKKKRQKHKDSEVSKSRADVGSEETANDWNDSEGHPEDVTASESQVLEFKAPENVEDSESGSESKKKKDKKKRKHREVSEVLESENVTDSESSREKKKKKRKRQDSEAVGESEEPKRHKKKKRKDSEDPAAHE